MSYYKSYDHDSLTPGGRITIDHTFYTNNGAEKLAALESLMIYPLEEVIAMRDESAAAEREIFETMQTKAKAWERQAAETALLDAMIEYHKAKLATHTSNHWIQRENMWRRSNAVYSMSVRYHENTRYDHSLKEMIPYSYSLEWYIYLNTPEKHGTERVAGQKKVFSSKADLRKYIEGRIKAHDRLFQEIAPPIPAQYARFFKVNGLLLPGYRLAEE